MMVHTLKFRGRQPRRGGFTLIELVMVLVILVILAGIAIPIVDWVRRSANYGAASSNQASLLNNLQLYRTTFGNGKYPSRFDSLLDDTGAAKYGALDGELTGMITVAPPASTSELESLTKTGISQVMDHEGDITLLSQESLQNSGIIERPLTATGNLAFVTPFAENDATAFGALTKPARELYAGLYPDSDGNGAPEVPADVSLVLFGVGPGNDAVGRTLQSPPLYTEADVNKTNARFIIAVATFDPRTGRRAQAKAILDPKGRLVSRNVQEYWQSVAPDAVN